MQSADVSEADRQFISSSLLSRLSDEDPQVLLAVLHLGPQVGAWVEALVLCIRGGC